MCQKGRRAAFTLVEMLVVIGIIMLLAGITLPAITTQGRAGRETSCRNNLKQIGVGLFSYMVNWDRVFIANRPPDTAMQKTPTPAFTSYDDLSPLWGVPTTRLERKGTTFEYDAVWTGRMIGNIRVFNCPSTRDVAGDLPEPKAEKWGDATRTGWWSWKDIRYKRTGASITLNWDAATSKYTVAAGIPTPPAKLSYEYCGEFSPSPQYIGINTNIAWLAHDEDANNENTKAVMRDKYYKSMELTATANHGKRGGNMLFLDGRVEWVNTQQWIGRVMDGIREWEKATSWKLADAYLGIP